LRYEVFHVFQVLCLSCGPKARVSFQATGKEKGDHPLARPITACVNAIRPLSPPESVWLAGGSLSSQKDRQLHKTSVRTAESGGVCGYDAAKKAKGRKRHIITDTCGFLVFILVHAADIQDRDGAVDVLTAIRYRFAWLRHVFADGGYAGDKLKDALKRHGSWTLEIIKRSDAAKGFVLLPRRWVVERTFAWLGRCRRLAKDWERSIESG